MLRERGLPVSGTTDALISRLAESDDPAPPPVRRAPEKPFEFMRLPAEIQLGVFDMIHTEHPRMCEPVAIRLPWYFCTPGGLPDNAEPGISSSGTIDSAQFEYVFDGRQTVRSSSPYFRRKLIQNTLRLSRISPQLRHLALRSLNMAITVVFTIGMPSILSRSDSHVYQEVLLLRHINDRSTSDGYLSSSDPEADTTASDPSNLAPNSAELERMSQPGSKKEHIPAPSFNVSEHRRVKLRIRGPRHFFNRKVRGGCTIWPATFAIEMENLARHVLLRSTRLHYLEIEFLVYLDPSEHSIETRETYIDTILKPLEGLRGLKEVEITIEDEGGEHQKLFTEEYMEHFKKLVMSPAENPPMTVQKPKEALSELEEVTTLVAERSTFLEDGSILVEKNSSIFGGPSVSSEGIKKP